MGWPATQRWFTGDDPHQLFTKKLRAAALEEVERAVRATWPKASGSSVEKLVAGSRVKIWTWHAAGTVVGEAWPIRPHWQNRGWYYRVARRPEAT